MKFWSRIATETVVCLALSLAAAIAAADPRESLSGRLAGMDVFVANFSQEIRGAQGQVLERSTGRFVLDRPRFKWEVDHPYPQTVVTDGDQLKVYDADLEQLTIRPLAEALQDTPVSLLTREGVALGDEFQVVEVSDELGTSYILTPNAADTLYAQIRLHFAGGALAALAITDHLGQFTEILFSTSTQRPVIQSSEFQLVVPPGTDVIGG
ncbi:MAG: outer membrane lipoprotein chaperone LolA [Pseudomonadales bacterium]|nr:outer membrane lipoprotein chaperone LolA [Pseudomonadales bacterium]NIX08888.1 outer membrane lipoprotein chaperone LolA [Pseudomonadales bacterium]